MLMIVFKEPVSIGAWVIILVLSLLIKLVDCGYQVARNAVGVPAEVRAPLT